MTFLWQTLCLVPAGAGCRFRFAVFCSLSLRPVTQWQIASWKLSELCRVVRFRWWGLLGACRLGCHLLFAIWGAAQHSVAFEIDEAFVVLANEAQITRQFLMPQHALLSFLASALRLLLLLFFFGCLSTERPALAMLFNLTNSLRSFSHLKHSVPIENW